MGILKLRMLKDCVITTLEYLLCLNLVIIALAVQGNYLDLIPLFNFILFNLYSFIAIFAVVSIVRVANHVRSKKSPRYVLARRAVF